MTTPSGQVIEVLGPQEQTFYEGQATAYMRDNKFTNTSDLLDLDRLVFMEMLVYRATNWLGSGYNYERDLLTPSEESMLRRSLKENSDLISKVKNDLGMTKTQRDKAQYESVGAYLTELRQRAKEFGIFREKQVNVSITLMKQLFAIIGAFDRSDAQERDKIGFKDEAEILEWVRTHMEPTFNALDEEFKQQQRIWVRKI